VERKATIVNFVKKFCQKAADCINATFIGYMIGLNNQSTIISPFIISSSTSILYIVKEAVLKKKKKKFYFATTTQNTI